MLAAEEPLRILDRLLWVEFTFTRLCFPPFLLLLLSCSAMLGSLTILWVGCYPSRKPRNTIFSNSLTSMPQVGPKKD